MTGHPRPILSLAVSLASFCCISIVQAQAPDRPIIGLVLTGTGEPSAANIGVIKALEDLRIPIDAIVGTSMGSVIGGAYASGLTVAELEAAFTATNWTDLTADAPVAEYLFADCPTGQPCTPADQEDILLARPDTLSGRNQDLVLQALARHAPPERERFDFNDLPIPFAAVTTNVETGQLLVIDRGSLVNTMRANMGTIESARVIRLENNLVFDVPGLTRPGMISAAHNTGVDVLIVVDVPPYPYRQISENSDRETILTQLVRILASTDSPSKVRTLGSGDYVVRPDLVSIKSRLQNAPEAKMDTLDYIERGMAATLELADLNKLSLSQQDYLSWRRRIETRIQ